jgi:hypothetical protein
MNSTEIQFTIQCLDGDSFPISIARTDAEKVFHGKSNLYNQYGLDVLKDAISVHNGTDPVIQQLVTDDSELTTSDSLIPLENKVITLIIKPSFYIDFVDLFDNWFVLFNIFQLDANLDFWRDDGSEPSTICYLQKVPHTTHAIEVLGQFRDFFKIAIKNIPPHLLYDSRKALWQYNISEKTPEYVWLRYDKTYMKIITKKQN